MSERTRNAQLLGFGLAALLLVLVGAIVVAIALRFVDGTRMRQRTQDAIAAIEGVRHAALVAVAAQNAYLLSGDDAQRTRYRAAAEDAQQALAELPAQLDPASAGTAASLQETLQRRFAVSDAAIDRRAGDADRTRDIAGSDIAAPIDRDVDAMFAALLRQERARLADQSASIERNTQWLLIAASLGIPCSLLVLAVVYQMLRREIETRRRAELAADASHCELNTSVEKLTRVSRDMQRLSAYASLLQSCDNEEEALSISEVSLAALLPDCAGTVYLLREDDEHGTRAEIAATWGDHVVPSAPSPVPHDCWAMRRAQPFATDPRTNELRCSHLDRDAAQPTAATLCIPLNAQGEALGLLYLSGSDPLPDENLAVTAAEQLSMALANLRMKETLRNQSIRDPLTGLFNRRHLEETLAREFARSTRTQRPLSVLMLDVDHFKKFNDAHGHPGGDALLSAVGRLLRTTSRAGDVPCRFGGEEFTVVMPETDLDGAVARGEEIRAAIAAMTVLHEGKPLARVTASLGASVYPQRAQSIDALLESADQALYQAKAGGRNRVLAAPAA